MALAIFNKTEERELEAYVLSFSVWIGDSLPHRILDSQQG
jgi:hypothetical protein